MHYSSTDINLAYELDSKDPLAKFRNRFVINDPDLIYLDGNSLGRLPKNTRRYMKDTVESQWGERLIRGWNENWIDTPSKLGSKIAHIIGAQPDEVLVCDSTSINLFKLAIAALKLNSGRNKIVSDELNFPSDLYILQGIVDLLGNRHSIHLLLSSDGIHIDTDSIDKILDQNTALVCLTHVAFKSAYMYDMKSITDAAHRVGAFMLWDLSHSTGAVPVMLNMCNVDLAVGCTYKYLNSGPGSPAYLYVRRDLQEQLFSPIWGWFADSSPFEFNLAFNSASDVSKFKAGTPPILSINAIQPAVEMLIEAGIERLRDKSVRQTEYLIYLANRWLKPLGFSIGSPLNSDMRGSHVSIRHPEAYRINHAMIESPPPAMKVIPDFRAPDNIRLGIAPIYTSFREINLALQRIRDIVKGEEYKKYSISKKTVT